MLNLKKRREIGSEQLKSVGNQCRMLSEQADSRLLKLHSAMIVEILTRIPISEIGNCRCVCKTLRSLISDPSFMKNFISKTPFLSILHGLKHNNFIFVKLLEGSRKIAFKYKKSKLVSTSFIPNSKSLEIIGCCNGLICLWDKFSVDNNYKLYITNPVLSEFTVFSNTWSDKYVAFKETYGFCFCSATGQYKVIKIKTRRAFLLPNQRGYYRKTEVWIYVVGSGKWRYVCDAPFPFRGKFCHVILNGRLHWIVDNDCKGPMYLHSLDIIKEQAHPVPAPTELRCEHRGMELGVLGEYLCFFDSSLSNHLKIWRMREYGVATSWTKDCIVTTSIRDPVLRPLEIQENGMILMSGEWGSIFCYDPKEGKFTKVFEFDGCGRGETVLYTPSFLSLEHVFSGAKKVKSQTWWRYV